MGLKGWVRNLPDGRVEAEFEGERTVLEDMLTWCKHGPRLAEVRSVECQWDTGPARHTVFHIR
jgi:acylphosphatase